MPEDPLDAVLERFAATGPEFGGGLSNHGPMASEALVALGHADAVGAWAEDYAKNLLEPVGERNAIASDEWREALGDVRRVGDWIAYFRRQVAENPWPELLDVWVARLSPGIMAAATHGVIRTAHAVRALDAGETPQRLREFATGLAYWAARYQELPVRTTDSPPQSMLAALQDIPRIDDSKRSRFLIFDAVRVLEAEDFGPAIDMAATDGPADAVIGEMTRLFVRQYLANPGPASIGFVHSVTAPSALRLLAPHLSDASRITAQRYVWQACAALYATYGRVDPSSIRVTAEPVQFDREDLAARAVEARDEHAIKFTEACLREYDHSKDGAFVVAANDAIGRLRR